MADLHEREAEAARPLPQFVEWGLFPFEGDLRVKPLQPLMDDEHVRAGEGDRPCPACASGDDAYLWVNDRWRLTAAKRLAVPAVLLETRDHLDLGDLDDEMAAELGQLTVRLDRAFRSDPDIARTHVNRWGDGAAHFHLWFYGRPKGTRQLLGFGLAMWAEALPPLPLAEWDRRLLAVAQALAVDGGEVIGNTRVD